MSEREMKAEQACRAVTDEAGWKISAASPGFTAKNGQNVGNAFNDSLNPIFGKMGQSVFSCKFSGGDVIFGMGTMRSESHGRPYIFTNARVISRDSYEMNMATDPEILLGMTANDFLTQDPYTGELAEATFKARKQNVAETAGKYRFDAGTFAELFYDIYEALTSGQILAVDTDISNDRGDLALILIEDMVYLALQGLPLNMRGQLSWSSGRDASCRICVSSKEGGAWVPPGRKIIHFDPYKKYYSDAARRDVRNDSDLLRRMSGELARMTPAAREEVLDCMDKCCRQISGTRPAYTRSVLLSSYYIYCMEHGRNISVIEALFLILLLLNDVKSGAIESPDDHQINVWLADFLKVAADHGQCPNVMMMKEILSRAFDEYENHDIPSKPVSALYETAFQALSYANGEGCLTLADEITKGRAGDRRQEAVLRLIKTAGSIPWSPEFAMDLFRWICRENINPGELADRCWENQTAGNEELLATLLDDNIDQEKRAAAGDPDAAGPLFNDVEMVYLSRIITSLCEEHKDGGDAGLTVEELGLLENHFGEFSEELKLACVKYLLQVKLSSRSDDKEVFRWIDGIPDKELRESLIFFIAEPENGYPEVWEKYVTYKYLHIDMSPDELSRICDRFYNKFPAMGVFESKAAAVIAAKINEGYEQLKDTGTGIKIQPDKYAGIYSESINFINEINISGQACDAAMKNARVQLAHAVDFENLIYGIMDPDTDVSRYLPDPLLYRADTDIQKKAAVAEKSRELLAARNTDEEYIHAVHSFHNILTYRKMYREAGNSGSGLEFTEAECRQIAKGLRKVSPYLWRNRGIYPADILLLTSIRRGEDGSTEYSMHRLDRNTEKAKETLEDFIGKDNDTAWPKRDADAAAGMSVLLKEDDALVRRIIKYAKEPGFDSFEVECLAEALRDRREHASGGRSYRNTPQKNHENAGSYREDMQPNSVRNDREAGQKNSSEPSEREKETKESGGIAGFFRGIGGRFRKGK